jgi:hypothetical protein
MPTLTRRSVPLSCQVTGDSNPPLAFIHGVGSICAPSPSGREPALSPDMIGMNVAGG